MSTATARAKRAAVVTIIETSTNHELVEVSERVELFGRRVLDARSAIERQREQETYWKVQQRVYAEKAKELKAKSKGARGAASLQADIVLANLAKHKGVASIFARAGNLIVRTPLVFCDIRLKQGTKETKRTCIGAFEFTFNPHARHVRVSNKLFRGHWSANGNVPCLGEYESEVRRLFDKGDFYALFDIMWMWLNGAGRDSYSYMRSHDWRDRYRSVGGGEARSSFAIGDYVVFNRDSYDGRTLRGQVGKVLSNAGSGSQQQCQVEFKLIEEGRSRNLYCPVGHLSKITEEEYNAADRYTVKTRVVKVALAIDNLKEGATIADAKRLTERIKRRSLILEPYKA
jgi:hypothetical protein